MKKNSCFAARTMVLLLPIIVLAVAVVAVLQVQAFSIIAGNGNRPVRRRQQRALFCAASSSATTASGTAKPATKTPNDAYDVIVVGSGIGGLSAAAMLAKYGYSVCVLESHYSAGGCAHGFTVRMKEKENTEGDGSGVGGDFVFDTGPSFFSGLNPNYPAKASNPLRTVLDAVGESVECIPYTSFGLKLPEGDFVHTSQFGKDGGVLSQVMLSTGNSNNNAQQEWKQLMEQMEPLAAVVEALPTAALRADPGVVLTVPPFLKNLVGLNPLNNLKLTRPFSSVLQDAGVSNPFTRNWLDLLCFCLSGLPANGTITAEMAMMMGEFYDDGAVMDCPVGGAKSIVDALVRGIEKHGGSVFLNSHVQEIVVDDNNNKGRATGIRLRPRGSSKKKNQPATIQAKKAVVSNLSVWDLFGSGILKPDAVTDKKFVQDQLNAPLGKSFMHLHVGFEMSRLELQKLEAHYIYLKDWSRGVAARDNAALVSIPSVHDSTLAPPGHGVLHAYTPATEDYDDDGWKGLDRNSEEYRQLKQERSQFLWNVLETIIPDIRARAKVVKVGTPLTHERFLNRYKGSYGPAIVAGEGSFPFPNNVPIKGLLVCGDSCFPGIGVPAVAGSGLLTANSVSFDSIGPQKDFLKTLIQDDGR